MGQSVKSVKPTKRDTGCCPCRMAYPCAANNHCSSITGLTRMPGSQASKPPTPRVRVILTYVPALCMQRASAGHHHRPLLDGCGGPPVQLRIGPQGGLLVGRLAGWLVGWLQAAGESPRAGGSRCAIHDPMCDPIWPHSLCHSHSPWRAASGQQPPTRAIDFPCSHSHAPLQSVEEVWVAISGVQVAAEKELKFGCCEGDCHTVGMI